MKFLIALCLSVFPPVYGQLLRQASTEAILKSNHAYALKPITRYSDVFHITQSQEFLLAGTQDLNSFDKLTLRVAKALSETSRCSEFGGIDRGIFKHVLNTVKNYLLFYNADLSSFYADLNDTYSLWIDENQCLNYLILKSEEFYADLQKDHSPFLVVAFQNIIREALSIQDIASSEALNLETNPRVKTYLTFYADELKDTKSIRNLSESQKKELLGRISMFFSYFTDKARSNKFLVDLSLALHSERANERYIFPLLGLMERVSLRGVTELNPFIVSLIGVANERLARKLSAELERPYRPILLESPESFQLRVNMNINVLHRAFQRPALNNAFSRAFVFGAFDRSAREFSNEFDYSFRGAEAINRFMSRSFRGNPYRALIGHNNGVLVGQAPSMGMIVLEKVPDFVANFFESTALYYNRRGSNDYNTCRGHCGKETLSRTFSDIGTGFSTGITTASAIAQMSGGILAMPGAASGAIAGFGHFVWNFTETLEKAKSCQAGCNRFKDSSSTPQSNDAEEKETESKRQETAQAQENDEKGEAQASEAQIVREAMNSIANEMSENKQSPDIPQQDVNDEHQEREEERNCQKGDCVREAIACVAPPGYADPIIRFYTSDDMKGDLLIKKGRLINYINDETRTRENPYRYRNGLELSILRLINFIDPYRNSRTSGQSSNAANGGAVIGQPGWVDPPRPRPQ